MSTAMLFKMLCVFTLLNIEYFPDSLVCAPIHYGLAFFGLTTVIF